MPEVRWFEGSTLNYARNALRTAWTDPSRTAIISDSERGRAGSLTYGELAAQVARVARGLRSLGVGRGDRVAALLPNVPEAVIGLLAAASLGAIWSSCSPDFGARSVIDRFAQIEPKVLIACDGYAYNGKEYSRAQMLDEVLAELPGPPAVVMVNLIGEPDESAPGVIHWDDLGAEGDQHEPDFEEVPFAYPLWVVYSSGTTGLPKPIMHGHGGVVLEHLKALSFHQDLRPGDVFTWYTTTGWMMWNYLAGGLLAGLTIVLYDGSATYPQTDRLWQLTAEHGITYLGVGAPYLVACMKAGLEPGEEHDLGALRAIGSTGSPLPPEAFDWVYRGQAGPAARLLLGRYRHLHRLRRPVPAAAGALGHHLRTLPGRRGGILRRGRQAGYRPGRRAGAHPADAVDAGRLLERPRRCAVPGELLRHVPGDLAARRLDRAAARRRLRHLRPLRRHPQPRRRPHGHQRVLPGRRGLLRGRRQPGGGHRAARRRGTADPVRGARRRGRARRRPEGQAPRGAPRSALAPPRAGRDPVPGIPRTFSGKKLEVPVRKILLGTEPERAADPNALADPDALVTTAGSRGGPEPS